MFQILDNDQKIELKDMLDKYPIIRKKFKEEKCSLGDCSYSYVDLTKVKLESSKTKFSATPITFTNFDEEKDTIVDYAPIYAIGALELLHYSMLGSESLIEHLWNTLTEELIIYNSYEEIEEQRTKFNDVMYADEQIYNLLLQMRTDYSSKQYKMLMSFIPSLMLCYEKNKRKFFEILFECLEYSERYFAEIVPELQDNDSINELKIANSHLLYKEMRTRAKLNITWLNKVDDLHLHKIRYKLPSGKNYYITDCRGFCILQTMKFYYYFLIKHGEMSSKEIPIMKYKNEELIQTITKSAYNCLGDDSQADAIKGTHNTLTVSDRGQFAVSPQKKFTLTEKTGKYNVKYPKTYYEDAILFKKAYNAKFDILLDVLNNEHPRDYNMNYVKFGDMLSSIIKTIRNIETLQTEVELKKINELEKENKKLHNELSSAERNLTRVKAELEEKQKYQDATEKVEALEKEIEELKSILESKSQIISTQVDELAQLNSKIVNMYNDDDIDENANSDEELDIPLEEMISTLNGFTFCFIGGFDNVIQKCEDRGWTNVKQINFDLGILNSSIPDFDFFAVFTKFCSHKLVRKIESSYSDISERTMYYNGVNIDMLIKNCYKLINNYFKE